MIRRLHESEYELLKPILAEYGSHLPSVDASKIVGIFDEAGNITGFATLQLVPHIEPVWVAEEHRGSDLWQRMVQWHIDELENIGITGDVFCFAPRKGHEKLLESKLGFEKMDWAVMRKTLK